LIDAMRSSDWKKYCPTAENAKHSRLEWAHFPVTPGVRRLRERTFMITGLVVHVASLMLTLIALYWIFRRE